MQQKVVTSEIFRGKKDGYTDSLNQPFARSRLGKQVFGSVTGGLGSEEHRPDPAGSRSSLQGW